MTVQTARLAEEVHSFVFCLLFHADPTNQSRAPTRSLKTSTLRTQWRASTLQDNARHCVDVIPERPSPDKETSIYRRGNHYQITCYCLLMKDCTMERHQCSCRLNRAAQRSERTAAADGASTPTPSLAGLYRCFQEARSSFSSRNVSCCIDSLAALTRLIMSIAPPPRARDVEWRRAATL